MIDIGMSELLVVGTVALIVIGPKDLPELFRSLGRMTAKMRAMSREFSRAMEAAANESGVKDVANDLRKVTSAKSMGLDAVKDAAAKFESWDPLKATKPARPVAAPKPIVADVVAEAPPMGPATQALVDAQADRKAAVQEVVAKQVAAKQAMAKKSVARQAAATPVETAAEVPPVKKPRAPRKPKPKADA